ncbi:MAG: YdeI/OmpD-associated family protein [Oricola sp.]|jgi:uncharacterized protein YdeI (YjbR/CyaY-like superfamily)|nr:YdeI/OmpD-associated family protein [Oricola sp.]
MSEVDKSFTKAKLWREEADALRAILLDSGLDEELKWGKPCYVHDGRNIAIIQRMKDFLALMFFKGALLDDPDGVLERQGPNSRSGFRVRFTSVKDVARMKKSVKALIREAVEAEKKGLKVEKPGEEFDLPKELADAFKQDPDFKAAFAALTPGRRRGYVLHFSGAKQSATRAARIEKCRDKIFDGKGFHDR